MIIHKHAVIQGSPPHTRGQDKGDRSMNLQVRITPAHAGTRATGAFDVAGWEDHPRTRGDKAGSVLLRPVR